MNHKTIIFDLDGTLLNTLEDLAYAYNVACGQFGCRVMDTDAFIPLIGNGSRHVVASIFNAQHIDSQHIDQCLKLFREAYSDTNLSRTFPYPGIRELVEALHERGIQMNVLSNKPQRETERCIEQFFDRRQFKVVWGQQDDRPLKPDPTTTHEILERCRTPYQKGIFIGDSEVDIRTAKNAEVRAVGVTWGFRDRDTLKKAGADVIIDDPREISNELGC